MLPGYNQIFKYLLAYLCPINKVTPVLSRDESPAYGTAFHEHFRRNGIHHSQGVRILDIREMR